MVNILGPFFKVPNGCQSLAIHHHLVIFGQFLEGAGIYIHVSMCTHKISLSLSLYVYTHACIYIYIHTHICIHMLKLKHLGDFVLALGVIF